MPDVRELMSQVRGRDDSKMSRDMRRVVRTGFGISLIAIAFAPGLLGADNQLTSAEREAGWMLLFDGRSLDNWMAGDGQPSKRPAEFGSINPHRAGLSMLVYKQQFSDFILDADFKITPQCNSGIFVRTYPLTNVPGQGVGYYGIEFQILDSR